MKPELPHEIKRLKSLADIGLLYHNNEYDKARYVELQEISMQLLSKVTGAGNDELKEIFPLQKDYPTAKVDVRGMGKCGLYSTRSNYKRVQRRGRA